MRFENKYFTEEFIRFDLKEYLKIFNFRKVYNSRLVSSIYYDHPNLIDFYDSEDGISKRYKSRIRWYNNSSNSASLEYKSKNGNLGSKEIYNLKDIDIKKSKKLIDKKNNCIINLPNSKRNYIPLVLINYERDYYFNSFNKIRLTFDFNLNFSKIVCFKEFYKLNNKIESNKNVLEIKYSSDYKANFIASKIALNYNLTLTRNSKYCDSINSIF